MGPRGERRSLSRREGVPSRGPRVPHAAVITPASPAATAVIGTEAVSHAGKEQRDAMFGLLIAGLNAA